MARVLYDLAGIEGRRFSPYCWRTKMALAHKGLDFEARPVRFTEIASICEGAQTTLPVLEDDSRRMRESFDIAVYLEEAYPDRPSLFGGEGGKAMARFVDAWTNATLNLGLVGLIVRDVYERLDPADTDYFRASREKRLGVSLEQAQEGRDARAEALRRSLLPLKVLLKTQPYLGGQAPLYPDYIVFGTLQWARVASPFQILAGEDALCAWFERLLDAHDGLGRREAAAEAA